MGFYVIEGTFHVVGYSPDGDSIRFRSANKNNWGLLSGNPVKINAREHVQLRLEAIDTLETHYGSYHQPNELAVGAMNQLLRFLQITDVQWNEGQKSVVSAKDGTPGYIISREIEKNGRPVAFAFIGTPVVADGTAVFLDAENAAKSINGAMLASGMAYPTYYKGLFHDIRSSLTVLSSQAKAEKLGVWAFDVSNSGFVVQSIEDITGRHVILPKLFRRLATYLSGGGSAAGFKQFLAANMDEVLHVPTAHTTHLDTFIEEKGDWIRLTEAPENLVFTG